MSLQYNLRLARIIQWTSGMVGIITIILIFSIILPCWWRLKRKLGIKVHRHPQVAPPVTSSGQTAELNKFVNSPSK